MPYPNEGTLTTDTREVAISETWDTQTEWEAYQSISDIEITNGVLTLSEIGFPTANLHAHYDWSNENTTTTTVPDLTGNGYDLSGQITSLNASINGVQAGEFDGVDDRVGISATSWDTITQPNTIYVVFEWNGNFGIDSGSRQIVSQNASGNERHQIDADTNSDAWQTYAGTFLNGSSNASTTLITALFNGSSSLLREDTSQTGSGDAGTESMEDMEVGSVRDEMGHITASIGEILVYDAGHDSTTISEVESYLNDKWSLGF